MAESDLERFKRQQNTVTDASLESTRNMVNMMEESNTTGAKTIEMLENQGEQLNRIEKGLDDINADMKQAEQHITQMEKFCGLCLMPWNRRKKIKDVDDAAYEKVTKDGSVVTRQPPGASQGASSSGPYIQRITNDAREDEMEDNMGQVGSMLGNLKDMASTMGEEIDRQNRQIDKIGAKAQVADTKVGSATKRTDKLIGK